MIWRILEDLHFDLDFDSLICETAKFMFPNSMKVLVVSCLCEIIASSTKSSHVQQHHVLQIL